MPKTVKGIVGDVGGTHARFAVASVGAGRPRIEQVKVLQASDHKTGHAAFRTYLRGLTGGRPRFAVIAAAGPIDRGQVTFTNNTAWRFNEKAVRKLGALKATRLINDFTAQALAIDILGPKDLRRLGPQAAPDRHATAAIIGPGTGFGAAALVADGRGRAVLTCEGGHASFAPTGDVELEIVRRLAARYGRASIERVLSGPGLLNLYQSLCAIEGRPAPLDQPDQVTHAGLAGDADAAAALKRFCAILGSVAGDLALTYGARRGVYISGGIAPDIFDFLATSDFRARFEDKGRMSDYVRAIPTFVVAQPFAALLGAASLLPELEAAGVIRARRARIVATLGPASDAPHRVLALAQAGVDVFRLNFSHGDHEDHAKALKAVRAAEEKIERPLAALADLQGPKFRIGEFKDGKIALKVGQTFTLDLSDKPGGAHRVGLPHPELMATLAPGAELLLDDGKVRLRVLTADADSAETEVVQGKALSDHKGVALPGAVIPMSPLTPKDREDLAFALRIGVDWVALSFVQHAGDMAELRRLVAGRASVLAKIEKPAALVDLAAILDQCDGVMVARGDLGVELEPEEVPVAQKTIIRAARRRGLPVIVATQMLESMTTSASPTRAEASDVANAVYEGADAMMLSAETAVGSYPVEAVSMMNRIIERVERDPNWPQLMDAEHGAVEDEDADALVAAARRAAEASSTACLAAFTTTGVTAMRLARERPLQPVLALTAHIAVARRLCLVWGVEPRLSEQPKGLDHLTKGAAAMAAELGLAPPNGRVLILAGTPFGSPGAANLLRLAHAPARR